MEEENLIKEQPETTCSVNVAAASEVKSNDESSEGSLYGKFKDADSLYSSYVQLEKEFTKKSQLLSELTKSEKIDNTPKVPIYKTENWREEVDSYMASKPHAKDFSYEVAKTLMQDEKMASEPNCLDLAYNKVLANHYVSKDELIKDKDFVDNYILNNENIKSKILDNYLSGLKKNSTPPIVIAQKGDSVGIISPTKPKTLREAKDMVTKLFNK